MRGKPGAVGFVTGGDILDGGDGNDLLIGDNSVVIAVAIDGPVGAADSGWLRNVHLDALSITGGQDILSGGAGNDRLIGDSQAVILAAVGANPFTALGGISVSPDTVELAGIGAVGAPSPVPFVMPVVPFAAALGASAGTGATGYHTVDVDPIVDQLTLTGGKDTLDGGTGDDALVGDNEILVAAVVQGPLVVAGPGAALPDRQLVDFDGLVGCLQATGASDTLIGGDGNDTLVGDNEAIVTAVLNGPVIQVGVGQAGEPVPRPHR